MFVITADQVGSRTASDGVGDAVAWASSELAPAVPPQRTAGDEFQILLDDASRAFAGVLRLTREGGWSVGIGIGAVRLPLAEDVRENAGDAFVAARDAVERAKRRSTRFALAGPADAPDVEALIDLLLVLRQRRSPEGWELHDLLTSGMTQLEAARRLGITPQAVSRRAGAAQLRVEAAASEPLVRLLTRLDESTGGRG